MAPLSDKQRQYNEEHFKKLDEIKLRPPKGTKDRWRAEAEKRNKSLSKFIFDSVENEISKEE